MQLATVPLVGGWHRENWIDPAVGGAVEYADYWNDEEVERGKDVFDVTDGNFTKIERHLADEGLLEDLVASIRVADRAFGARIKGVGIDLAAGSLWAARPLLDHGDVHRLYCLEYSRHRLFKLGPLVLAHYGIPADRVILAYGSFYDIKLPSAELDFALLAQALHHADEPVDLLRELARVLKPGGVALVIGEPVVTARQVLRYYLRMIARLLVPRRMLAGSSRFDVRLTLRPAGEDIAPTDPTLGDHYYRPREYRAMFEKAGFAAVRSRRRGEQHRSYVLQRSSTHPEPPERNR